MFEPRVDDLLRAGIDSGVIESADNLDLRGCQTARVIHRFARDARWIEIASCRVFQNRVLHPIEHVAGVQYGVVKHGEFFWWNEARGILVQGDPLV